MVTSGLADIVAKVSPIHTRESEGTQLHVVYFETEVALQVKFNSIYDEKTEMWFYNKVIARCHEKDVCICYCFYAENNILFSKPYNKMYLFFA